ncbi:DUF6461 domain-containing protein [Streptomyces noursei]|uniref:DUF6461 domain-containing protein n=1 Tax=Streptomyces noursei TaxID=1971 RepID=UPI001966AE47|nr:DUF6461 domain-containing protein [Streptomyces noursei]QRX89998.1 hypothetical protein JNO44_03210 [Streptomyces noursei]
MQPDPLAPFRWLEGHRGPLGDIFCVSFCRGLDPAELLRRFGAPDTPAPESCDLDELLSRVGEFVAETRGGDGGGHVGVVRVGDWSMAVEPWGWRATLSDVATALSAGAEFVAVSRHDYAEDGFVHAVDGELVTAFAPYTPGRRHGSAPDRWTAAMAEVGLDPRPDGQRHDHRIAAAFALAAKATGVAFTPEVLAGPLLVGDLRGPAA